jgi:hypothetical protein
MTRKIRNSNISTGTIDAGSLTDTGVTAGSYGSASQVPVLTVNAKGQIITATTTNVAGVSTFTYTSGTRTLNISTADGGSFDAALSNLATETFVNNAVAALVDSSPTTLDTLNELAAALGDDPNYATTITSALGNKVDKINITGATVGSATQIPVITYNAQGQITGTTTAALDLSTKVDKINITGSTVGSSSAVPVITYNAQGQITSTSTAALGALATLNSVGTAQISGWEQSLSGTGYLKFPGGLIFQWTRSGGHSSESDYTQSFPITFPNACLRVIIGTEEPDGSRDAMWQLRSFNTSSVTARLNQLNGAGGTAYMNIFAIGY